MAADMNALYHEGFEFRRIKPWRRIAMAGLYAVKVNNGIAYCHLVDVEDNFSGLFIYVGESGLRTLYGFREVEMSDDPTELEAIYADFLACTFEYTLTMDESDTSDVRAYAREHHFHAPLPHIRQLKPYTVPHELKSEEARDIMLKCLRVANLLGTGKKKDLKLSNETLDPSNLPATIPLMDIDKDGQLVMETTVINDPGPVEYARPEIKDELMLARLKAMKHTGVMQADIHRLPVVIGTEDAEDDEPFYPAVLMMVNPSREDRRIAVMASEAIYDPNELLDGLMSIMGERAIVPREIRYRTDETFALLDEFCKRAGVKLVKVDKLDYLDTQWQELREAALSDFLDDDDEDWDEDDWDDDWDEEDWDDDEAPALIDPNDDQYGSLLKEMFQAIEDMPLSQLRDMPASILSKLRQMEQEGMLPEKVAQKIRRL